ncbi:MAG: hypothetical protein HDT23_06035, partial [Ruminococcus sp.]|nr:hypothetical protein [Ruminococcus sp.]
NEKRCCLWLLNATPKDLQSMSKVIERIKNIKRIRLNSKKLATQKFTDYPTRFMEIRQPIIEYILVPSHSSENRRYILIGFENADVICGDANNMLPDATLYHFGVLTSNVHMAFIRAVAGRLEMRYRYSKDIVYNNFPFSAPSSEQRERIERTARAILDARNFYLIL